MQSYDGDFSIEEARERGIEDFLNAPMESLSPALRTERECFLAACRLTAPGDYGLEWDVRIATIEDMRREGRICSTVPGSAATIQIDDVLIADIGLDLIDISGGYIFSNQTVLVPHAWLLVEEIRHMNYSWLEEGAIDPRTGPNNLTNLHPRHRTARMSLTGSPLKLPNSNVYFLFHGFIGTTSFGHFLFDLLGQLVIYDELKLKFGDKLVPVITAAHWFRFKWPGMTWLFEQLVGPETDILHLEGDCRAGVTRGFTTSRVARNDNGLSFAAVRYVHERIRSRLSRTPGIPTSKRVYISRKDAGSREVDNIDDVETVLAAYGFQTILIEYMTPQEAYDALSEAEVVIGMHGSGLMYHFYAKPGATVIELSNPATMWTIILATASALGHKAVRIRNEGGKADIEQLSTVLSEVCV